VSEPRPPAYLSAPGEAVKTSLAGPPVTWSSPGPSMTTTGTVVATVSVSSPSPRSIVSAVATPLTSCVAPSATRTTPPLRLTVIWLAPGGAVTVSVAARAGPAPRTAARQAQAMVAARRIPQEFGSRAAR
jgi:hypothetical protein